jgi:RNA polymerase sigma factor (sigma-70 family)
VIHTDSSGETLCDRASQAFSAYRDGDRSALDSLVALVTPLLWHTVRGQGLDPVAAEDVVQTIWMRLLHSGEAIRDPQTIVQWLLTASRREAWRVAKRIREEQVRTGGAGARGLEDDGLARLPDRPDRRPDEVVLRESADQRLWEHVERLPERCRQLIRVIAFADRPDYAVIAESLGMPVGSIGPTRGRCLAKLRQELAADPSWEGSEP